MTRKKHLLFTVGILLFSIGVIKAQDNMTQSDSIYSKVDVLPEFPGGMKALGKYVDGKIIIIQKRHDRTKLRGR